jgi:hypothetical protein
MSAIANDGSSVRRPEAKAEDDKRVYVKTKKKNKIKALT